MSLKVGQREFIGQGTCRQGARHNAAEKAIHILHNLPVTAEKKLEPKPPSPTEAEAVEGQCLWMTDMSNQERPGSLLKIPSYCGGTMFFLLRYLAEEQFT